MSNRIHFESVRERTNCGGEDRDDYGRVRVRIGHGDRPREAYYDLNATDGTAEPRLITADRLGRFFDESGHAVGTTYVLTDSEKTELQALISGNGSVPSTGTADETVCRQLRGVSAATTQTSIPSNLTGWIAVPSLLGDAALAACLLSPVVRAVDGFSGSTNDMLAGGICGAGLALTAANAWEGAAVSRGGHVAFDVTQGTLLAASLVLIPLMDDPRPALLTSMSLATSIGTGRLRSELSSPLWGDSVQTALGAAMLVPGLMLATQTSQPVPAASLYRMPGSTMHSQPPTPSPEEIRFGWGMTLAGGFNLIVGATSIVWHATHPRTSATTTARNWSLFPMATRDVVGAGLQLRF